MSVKQDLQAVYTNPHYVLFLHVFWFWWFLYHGLTEWTKL